MPSLQMFAQSLLYLQHFFSKALTFSHKTNMFFSIDMMGSALARTRCNACSAPCLACHSYTLVSMPTVFKLGLSMSTGCGVLSYKFIFTTTVLIHFPKSKLVCYAIIFNDQIFIPFCCLNVKKKSL